jgi:hypothetical protein
MPRPLLPLLLLLATVSFPAFGADAPAKPKSRTIEQLIQLTVKEGFDKDFSAIIAAGLGLQGSSPTRSIAYGADQTADQREHQFYVVFDQPKKKKLGLVWGSTLVITHESGARSVDGYKYWTTLSGRLISVLHSFGKEGEVQQDRQSIKSAEVKAAFEREKLFFLVDAIPLD